MQYYSKWSRLKTQDGQNFYADSHAVFQSRRMENEILKADDPVIIMKKGVGG